MAFGGAEVQSTALTKLLGCHVSNDLQCSSEGAMSAPQSHDAGVGVGSAVMPKSYLERVLRANVYDVARETPLESMQLLSERLGHNVLLKREDLQPVFSFKIRGAYNKIAQLDAESRARGVVCASAGNHAQGVALAARKLGLRAVVVMPTTTPRIKSDAVERLGGEVVIHGVSVDESFQRAHALADDEGLVFVHPFDDIDVIAGQGTIGLEILRQHGNGIDAIFVPVGGGGLISGIAAYVKSLWPEVKIIGVEPEDAATMHAALEAGRPVGLDEVGLFADGVAVRTVGAETYRIASECVDEIVLVDTDEICAAILDIFEDTRSIAEPAGALAVAGLKSYAAGRNAKDETLIAILSGANVNFDRLRHISERADIGREREALFAVTIPERPGSLRQFCEVIGSRSITEFNYRYADQGDAQIFVGLELQQGRNERDSLLADLTAAEFPVVDMTDNELAKIHVRYMVGGHGGQDLEEKLYRFFFPERPGALLGFLNEMGQRWNISLFHYRNHGSAYGRVLMGFQVTTDSDSEFREFLENANFPYVEETENPVYEVFLK